MTGCPPHEGKRKPVATKPTATSKAARPNGWSAAMGTKTTAKRPLRKRLPSARLQDESGARKPDALGSWGFPQDLFIWIGEDEGGGIGVRRCTVGAADFGAADGGGVAVTI